jgi:hypothetical protein
MLREIGESGSSKSSRTHERTHPLEKESNKKSMKKITYFIEIKCRARQLEIFREILVHD